MEKKKSILITSGPTREYLDPVRYISNASSGRMGRALAEAALAAGYEVTVVSGPVEVEYPKAARVIPVVTTEEMYRAARDIFPKMTGAIGAAAPCDYQPAVRAASKLSKESLTRGGGVGVFSLELRETPDIIASLGAIKRPGQWLIPFALETENARARALEKLRRKNGDLILVNNQSAIGASASHLQILAPDGEILASLSGTKESMATELFRLIEKRFGSGPERAV